MGLGGCYSIIKYFLVFFNIIFWLIGLVGTVFAVWMLVDPTFSVSLTQDAKDYIISLCIVLVASIVLMIISIIGIVGALRVRQCPLVTFFSLMLVILVAEIATGVWAYVNKESLNVSLRNAVKMTVDHEYYSNNNRKVLFDSLQENLECCGAKDASDWTGANQIVLTVSANPVLNAIPKSCCRKNITPLDCDQATKFRAGGIDYSAIYNKGCYDSLKEKLEEYGSILMIILVVIGSIQFLSLIFALILACAASRSNRYKA